MCVGNLRRDVYHHRRGHGDAQIVIVESSVCAQGEADGVEEAAGGKEACELESFVFARMKKEGQRFIHT